VALYVSRKLRHYQWLCKAISPTYLRQGSTLSIPTSDTEWREIIYMASIHGILPCLFVRLKTNQLLEHLPKDASEALEGFYELNCLFNMQLRDQIIATTSLLNAQGIKPIWLKGASNLLASDWQTSSRTMLDLDLWIPESNEQQRAIEILTNDGYFIQPESVGADYGSCQHYAPIIKPGQPARLEIHRHIVSPFCPPLLPDEIALKKIVWKSEEYGSFGTLSPDNQIMQSYLQCTEQGVDCFNPRNTVRLMKMLDFLGRFASPDLVETWFNQHPLLDVDPWKLKARQFGSHLNCYFSISYPRPVDQSYLRKITFALNFPKLETIGHIIGHGSDLLRRGKLGPPKAWPGKLYRQLLTLKNNHS